MNTEQLVAKNKNDDENDLHLKGKWDIIGLL